MELDPTSFSTVEKDGAMAPFNLLEGNLEDNGFLVDGTQAGQKLQSRGELGEILKKS